MTKAIWNGATIAESDDIALVEGNAYFPADGVRWEHFRKSESVKPTYCHWKGYSEYYDVLVDGAENGGAAWFYPDPYAQAAIIKDRVAFWSGVEIVDAPEGAGLVEKSPSVRDGLTGWEALCWLLSKTPKTVLTPADVTENSEIPESELEQAWQVYDVQRYATHYRWQLVRDDAGAPVRLEKAP